MSFAFPWSTTSAMRAKYSLVVLLFVAAIVGMSVANAATIGPIQNVSNDAGESIRPRVAQDPNGNIHVVWSSNEGSRIVRYAKGTWNGSSYAFGSSFEIANVGPFQYATPYIAVAPNNTVMVAWSDGTIRLRTWDASAAAPGGTTIGLTGGITPSLYPDAQSNFHIAWNGDFLLQYCEWNGSACSNRAAFADTENAGNRPDVAVDSNNNVHIVWDSGQAVHYRSRAAGAVNFSGIQTIGGGNNAQITADGTGNVHIVRSQDYQIIYCRKTISTNCGNVHPIEYGASTEPSIGATRGGDVVVGYRGGGAVAYSVLEKGVWQPSQEAAGSGFTVDVSARPYTCRVSAVWGQNFEVQHRVIGVGPGAQSLVGTSAATTRIYLPMILQLTPPAPVC